MASVPNRAELEKLTKKQLVDALTAAGHKALSKYDKTQLVNIAMGLPPGEKVPSTRGRGKLYTREELTKMTIPEIKEAIRKKKLTNYSQFTRKPDLIEFYLNPSLATTSPKKRGRPPGKTTPKAPVSPKRKPGRPPGKTTPKAPSTTSPKRGRPKGKGKASPRQQRVAAGPAEFILDSRGLLIRNPEFRG